jgi:hypothetical protein
MKLVIFLTIANILVAFTLSSFLRTSVTPQGINLKNHFGLPSVESVYGPKVDNYAEYVRRNNDTFAAFNSTGKLALERGIQFVPYKGHEKYLNPHVIKAGDLTNIAPSATTLINPATADPKLEVRAKIKSPVLLKVPTFYGLEKDWRAVKAYNKETGQIVNEKVLFEAPKMGYETKIAKLNVEHNFQIDIKTGKKVELPTERKFHGTD